MTDETENPDADRLNEETYAIHPFGDVDRPDWHGWVYGGHPRPDGRRRIPPKRPQDEPGGD